MRLIFLKNSTVYQTILFKTRNDSTQNTIRSPKFQIQIFTFLKALITFHPFSINPRIPRNTLLRFNVLFLFSFFFFWCELIQRTVVFSLSPPRMGEEGVEFSQGHGGGDVENYDEGGGVARYFNRRPWTIDRPRIKRRWRGGEIFRAAPHPHDFESLGHARSSNPGRDWLAANSG